MDDPTQKFKDVIKEHKNTSEDSESTPVQSVLSAANKGISLIVGISQLCLVYLSYFLLSQKFGWTYFSIWEFLGIGIGALSLLAFIRNYIKDIIRNTGKTN